LNLSGQTSKLGTNIEPEITIDTNFVIWSLRACGSPLHDRQAGSENRVQFWQKLSGLADQVFQKRSPVTDHFKPTTFGEFDKCRGALLSVMIITFSVGAINVLPPYKLV
jgi:hypothetical protein